MTAGLSREQIVAVTQYIQRDRKELEALLADVADAVTESTRDGGAVIHLSPELLDAIRRRTED